MIDEGDLEPLLLPLQFQIELILNRAYEPVYSLEHFRRICPCGECEARRHGDSE